MKKILSLILAIVLTFCMVGVVSAETITANPTTSKVVINGVEKFFEAYNINDNNYFKLRDIAYVLSETDKKFAIDWQSETNTAILETEKEYVAVGGELTINSNFVSKNAVLSNTNIVLNNEPVVAKAYLIDGNNYFKLRDLGNILDFSVEWEQETQTVIVSTETKRLDSTEYTEVNFKEKYVPTINTQDISAKRWARVSGIQQFNYMNEGVGYAYVENSALNIVLPKHELTINMLYPILGDVIADETGNIYIVWGKENNTENYYEPTVFISKYSSNGILIETTSFVGDSIMGDIGNTKDPFYLSNVSTIITPKRTLLSLYSREMYNGHQSNNLVGLNIDNMEPIVFRNGYEDAYDDFGIYPYCSHSFGNDIIWSKKMNNPVAISHADANGRGFVFYAPGNYATLFHFFLPSNVGGDMGIVNETFAQLGGIIETSKGVVLVGASAKSISANAKNEVQNLFIQIVKPEEFSKVETLDLPAEIFIGGEERSGSMSFNVYDTNNSALRSVTDYGVHWLTNYASDNVVRPQVVEADDKIVILWTHSYKNYYMILSNEGNILVPETEINVPLNSYEKPVYINGKVQWVYTDLANTGNTGLGTIEID